jgi:hypothetical protein
MPDCVSFQRFLLFSPWLVPVKSAPQKPKTLENTSLTGAASRWPTGLESFIHQVFCAAPANGKEQVELCFSAAEAAEKGIIAFACVECEQSY